MGRITAFAIAVAVLVGIRHPVPVRPYALRSADSPLEHVAVVSDSYTTGTNEGGLGSKAWTARAWQILSRQGVQVTADVAAEGRAGYGAIGDHGSTFGDLTVRAVRPDDALVVFFGSRNDQGVDLLALAGLSHNAFDLAHRTAPGAKLLVIGPAWPTADVPGNVLQIRDTLSAQAWLTGAAFVDPIAEGWFVGRPDLIGADGVHPTDAGHAYLAEKIAPLIRGQLPMRV
ncbi:GDSL lipase [Mycobacterium sp. pUA109]|uniref:Rv0518 family GDSL lipase n=1 Tax=Mycobacterium sp. pUA109 TaxID=3238982 RepID=UPI00351ABD3F